jgi:hypothetical protein
MNKFIYWTPRILSIFFIAFLAMFSLDVIESGKNIWEILGGLFMHNVPVFILVAVLAVAWKHEIVGATVFILAGVLYVLFAPRGAPSTLVAFSWSLIIAGPAFLIGILFFAGWKKKRG